MLSSTYSRFHACLLGTIALLPQTEAAVFARGKLSASLWVPQGTLVNDTRVFGVHDTSDGCPVGWVPCSASTCYPLDGSTCCSNGNFCEFGSYCDGGGCCLDGEICGGSAPPPSTINVPTATTPRTTATTPRTTTTATIATTFKAPTTSVSVGFSTSDQITELGSVSLPTVAKPTEQTTVSTRPATVPVADSATVLNPSASASVSLGNDATAVSMSSGASVWLAGLVVIAVFLKCKDC
ncbi:hypothetical protein DICSQDRAFT_184098 [Dichomitus squalens LYAD-421 SS1]|uniref:Granulins domain-containing protein n=1 Tax=Dichomitus squalens (strain LYAD-421) TaxID=732165 RepID=R7SIC2_DICSQ|nr:uncharacterized protein DICSQDRAFT_184098 [Dichomitus squalens LYAD-421 SS1]EJF55911.1 hypothetical protein DICSQDRAFT_184098 [Dichomitus squalens LYAD-421 SS1]